MTDGDRADAALCLRRLAGIVDDEGIDHRHRAEDDFRRAGARKRDRFAGQPFERAVGSQMDHRIDFLNAAKPQVESEIGVTRSQCRIVIFELAGERAAAIGLYRDDKIAGSDDAKSERAFVHSRIIGACAPLRVQHRNKSLWSLRKRAIVFGERQHRFRLALR